nr:heme biosynthesis HemY N-terminal domain-containing protein [uncultured Rhodopila sp.]
MTATIGTFTVSTSAAFAILALIFFVVAVVIVARIVYGIIGMPRTGGSWRRRRRAESGETSVTRVLVALAAGDERAALKQARRARLLLGDSPQVLLLQAEASRLAGREDEANEAFLALSNRKDARFLGLRGLLRQAIDRRDWPQALAIANQAEAIQPGTSWLRQQRAELALQTENWAEALDLIGPDARRPAYLVAAADAESDSSRALGYAKQAWKADPKFTPAVLAYARRLRAAGNEKRARTYVTDAWALSPHPELAEFLLALEPDASSRLKAAKQLVQRNATNPESRFLVARASLDAGLTAEARTAAEAALADGINQRRLSLLIAEIEEIERGDTEAGRLAQRNALRQAASADPDPHWQCSNCRAEHVTWQPKCSSCGSVATLQWVTEAGTRTVPAIIG